MKIIKESIWGGTLKKNQNYIGRKFHMNPNLLNINNSMSGNRLRFNLQSFLKIFTIFFAYKNQLV